MQNHISIERIASVFQRVQNQKILAPEDNSLIFYDFNFLADRINHLKEFFPSGTLHSVAIKANPLVKVLSYLKQLGTGAEAATLPEVYLALKSGYLPGKIVFDSPAKTYQEIEYALKAGVYLNADSFDELERINQIKLRINSTSQIGLRVNPNVGMGSIRSTSVAGTLSKFGIPMESFRQKIIDQFLNHKWLTGIHLHVGSQGCSIEQLVMAVEKVYSLVEEINTLRKKNNQSSLVNQFDIGGGFPVSYHWHIDPPLLSEYVALLKSKCPSLFSDSYQVITEFGRYIHANSGWTVSQVEYVKHSPDGNIAVIHVGADLLMRRAYKPEDWYHEVSVLDSKGQPKRTNESETYSIAGPLCFNGDFISRDIKLPKINAGDYIIIHDSGAYTLSMWSRHTSRQIPKVVGYFNDGETFEILKPRESLDDILNFWQ